MLRHILTFILISACTSAFAQGIRIGDAQYNEELERQINASPRTQFLHKHADVFKHVLHNRVCEKLGIDPAGNGANEQTAQALDTSFVRNISKSSSWQNETTIGINRLNRNIIVAGANDGSMQGSGMPAYTTTDGGNTWKTNRVKETGGISPGTPLGDPMIAVDDSGYFYYAYLCSKSGGNLTNIAVATSKDGKKWAYNKPIMEVEGFFEDKEHIIVDNSPTSPYYGRVYVAWVRFSDGFDAETSGMCVAYSDDRCITWSEPQMLRPGFTKFSQVRTGKNGEVFISFTMPTSGGLGFDVEHAFARSFDGGDNFDIQSISSYAEYPFINLLQRPGLKGDQGFRAVPYTSFDVDQRTGTIHMLYGSYNDTATGIQAAIEVYTTSTNNGSAWAEGLTINTTSNPGVTSIDQDRFMPWVSIDQKTGDVHSIFYTSELDQDNVLTTINHLKLNSALDNTPSSLTGTTFDPAQVFHTGGAPFLGDYIGCDAHDSVFAATWTENRPNFKDGEVFAYVSSPNNPKSAVRKVVISSRSIWLAPISPNPVTGSRIAVQYYFPKNTEAEFALYDALGKKIVTLSSGMIQSGTSTSELVLPTLSSGNYFLKLTTPLGVETQKLIVE